MVLAAVLMYSFVHPASHPVAPLASYCLPYESRAAFVPFGVATALPVADGHSYATLAMDWIDPALLAAALPPTTSTRVYAFSPLKVCTVHSLQNLSTLRTLHPLPVACRRRGMLPSCDSTSGAFGGVRGGVRRALCAGCVVHGCSHRPPLSFITILDMGVATDPHSASLLYWTWV